VADKLWEGTTLDRKFLATFWLLPMAAFLMFVVSPIMQPGPGGGAYFVILQYLVPILLTIMVAIAGPLLSTKARFVVIAATLLFAVTMLDYLAGFILFPFAPGPYALAILLLSVIIPVLTAPLKPRFLKFRGIGDAAIVWFLVPMGMMIVLGIFVLFMDLHYTDLFGPFPVLTYLFSSYCLSFKTIEATKPAK
jgi:hypothetical protein